MKIIKLPSGLWINLEKIAYVKEYPNELFVQLFTNNHSFSLKGDDAVSLLATLYFYNANI